MMRYYKDDPIMMKRVKKDKTLYKFKSYDCNTVQLVDSFIHYGANGKHYVMAFEILGVNLLEIIKRYDYKGIPMNLVRILAKQCLIGLDYLNRMCNLIHTDLKPENVVISLKKEELREIYDNGCLRNVKSYRKFQKLKERGIAGTLNDYTLISSKDKQLQIPERGRSQAIEIVSQNTRHPSLVKYETLDQKDKKKYRKKKRTRERKYMKQERLPEDYDDFSQEEKDELYYRLRIEIGRE